MRFTVLGPVGASKDGRPLPALAPRQRAILAYLLLHARTVISAERLIGAMWGMTPPDTARAQIQASIAAIRKVLPDGLLVTRTGGYVILPEPGQLDLEEFTGLVGAAQDLAAEQAAPQIRRALGLWRGQPLVDVNADYSVQARARLEERRLAAVERLADLELHLGAHEGLIDELTVQVAAHPLRERLAGHLMLALYRSGRQADALAVARTFRTALADQQGLDPSQPFQALEQSILRNDPSLDLPRADPAPEPVTVASRSLSFLPFDVPDFAGRSTELDQLADAWSSGGGMVTISAIDGMAGIGKTTLAVHAAHRLADRYPDGQLFVDLHAHTTGQAPVEPSAALETLLRQLGLPAERIPASPADRSALWRTELLNRRALVVLDNVLDTDQVRPLLPGATHSLMLITSRHRLIDLDGADLLSIEVLPAQDAAALFTAIVGARAEAEPVAVLDVLQLCGFLPLAVRIAAARLRHRPRWTVAYLADRLRDERRRLSELTTTDRGVAAAFTLSYEQLDADQQRMFRLLSLHPGIDFDTHAAAALADLPVNDAEELLEALLDAHMLLQYEVGRYTFHDLLHDHAHATVTAAETAHDRYEALTRLIDLYLRTACAAIDFLYPDSREFRPRIPDADSADKPFNDPAGALTWLDTERATLIAVAAHAAENDWPDHAIRLAPTLHRYLDEHAHFDNARTIHSHARHASHRQADKVGEGRALVDLGEICRVQGHYKQAEEFYQQALELYREIGDRIGIARALTSLGGVSSHVHDYEQARDYYQRSLDLCRELGVRIGQAAGLANLGSIYERCGHFEQAHAHHREALDLARELGHRTLEADVLANLGLLYLRQEQHEQALEHQRRALTLYRDLGHRVGEADALNSLGETARSLGAPARSTADHDAALAIATEVGSRLEQARAHHGLAFAHHDLDHLGLARSHAEQALGLFTELGTPEVEEVRAFLSSID